MGRFRDFFFLRLLISSFAKVVLVELVLPFVSPFSLWPAKSNVGPRSVTVGSAIVDVVVVLSFVEVSFDNFDDTSPSCNVLGGNTGSGVLIGPAQLNIGYAAFAKVENKMPYIVGESTVG